ncbi:hypothetical protein CVT26_000647, partial [Gymnopilus dilepis]
MSTSVIQRPFRGSRISTFYPVKSLPSLSSLDSAFQLQEYISLLIRLDVHDVEAITSLPGGSGSHQKDGSEDKDKGKGKELSNEKANEKEGEEGKGEDRDGEKGKGGEVSVDEACWIYEQLRRLAQDLSHPLITTLQQECTRASCPEMKAGEWLYLCVAHGNDGAMEQCCAIDYILHTIDSATALLNSPRTFPSRLSIPATSHRHFSSLARRLGRIFAHAYFHHREAFEQAEAESSLYARFLALTSKFDLVPAEFLVIPPLVGGSGQEEEDVGRGETGRAGLAHTIPQEIQTQGRLQYLDSTNGRRHPSGIPRPISETSGTSGMNAQKYLEHHQAQHLLRHPHHLQGQLGQGHPSAPPSTTRPLQAERTLTSAQFGAASALSPRSPQSSPSQQGQPSPGAQSQRPGEQPQPNSAGTRSRFGRSRTDTMVFADAEASAVVDELAARARAGELEPEPVVEPVPEPLHSGEGKGEGGPAPSGVVGEPEVQGVERQGHAEEEGEAPKTARPSEKELDAEGEHGLEPEPEPVLEQEHEPHTDTEGEGQGEGQSYAEVVKSSSSGDERGEQAPVPEAAEEEVSAGAKAKESAPAPEAPTPSAEGHAEAAEPEPEPEPEHLEITFSPNEDLPAPPPPSSISTAAPSSSSVTETASLQGLQGEAPPPPPEFADQSASSSSSESHPESSSSSSETHPEPAAPSLPAAPPSAPAAPSEPQLEDIPLESDRPLEKEPEEVKSEDPLLVLGALGLAGNLVGSTSVEEVEALLEPLEQHQVEREDTEQTEEAEEKAGEEKKVDGEEGKEGEAKEEDKVVEEAAKEFEGVSAEGGEAAMADALCFRQKGQLLISSQQQCCAIDYILHTIDSATALLNSPRTFPSRLSIPATSHRHFSSLARRLGRIFAHAYFHHREAFEQAEAESSLYARFLALTSKFELVPAEFLVIPPLVGGSGQEEEDVGRGDAGRAALAHTIPQEIQTQGRLQYLDSTNGRRHPSGIPRPISETSGSAGMNAQKYLEHHQAQHLLRHPHHLQGQLGQGHPSVPPGSTRPLQPERTLMAAQFGAAGALSPRSPGQQGQNQGRGQSQSQSPGDTQQQQPNSAGAGTRSRFGRSRTDTMVFADAEASAVVDELAARARAGELEPEPEPEAVPHEPVAEAEAEGKPTPEAGVGGPEALGGEGQGHGEAHEEAPKTARPGESEQERGKEEEHGLEPEPEPVVESEPHPEAGAEPAEAAGGAEEPHSHSYAEAVKSSSEEEKTEVKESAPEPAPAPEAPTTKEEPQAEAAGPEPEPEPEPEHLEITFSPNEDLPPPPSTFYSVPSSSSASSAAAAATATESEAKSLQGEAPPPPPDFNQPASTATS